MKFKFIVSALVASALVAGIPSIYSCNCHAGEVSKMEEQKKGVQDKNAESSGETESADKTSDGKAAGFGTAGDPSDENTILSLFKKGGVFMWPVLFFAALGMAFIVERFIFFARAKLASKEFIDKIEQRMANDDLGSVQSLCEESNNRIAKILMKGLELRDMGYERVEKTLAVAGAIEVATLERGLNILSATGNIVPMLGFLGTVSGMINAFAEIAKADQVKASLVAGGIQEALLTTAAGLIVAIPVLAFYNYFVHKIEIFISDVERISSDMVEILIRKDDVKMNGTGAAKDALTV